MKCDSDELLVRENTVREISVSFVSRNFEELLGIRPARGHGLSAAGDETPGPPRALLSHQFWMREFGGAPDVLGATILVERKPVIVAGVMPREFHGISPGHRVELYLPMSAMKVLTPSAWNVFLARDSIRSAVVVGRIRLGVTETAASADVHRAYEEFVAHPESIWVLKTAPDHFTSGTVSIRTQAELYGLLPEACRAVRELHPAPLITYERTLERQVSDSMINEQLLATLSILFGAMALALAVVGIHGVMAQLVASRRQELGVRLALGAKPAQIVWSVLREVLLLALAGTAAGLLVAAMLTNEIAGFLYGVPHRLIRGHRRRTPASAPGEIAP